VVAHDSAAGLETPEGRQCLFGQAGRSLPPIDGVFRLGSRAVQRWLRANNWDPKSGYNDNFADRDPVRQYERRYQSECPLYRRGAHAVLGGWHFPWPDGDWEELLKQALLVWTFKDSEPWVEVWRTKKGYRVIQRIT
jgi:hypothetical protein